jgi:hypothetical protein
MFKAIFLNYSIDIDCKLRVNQVNYYIKNYTNYTNIHNYSFKMGSLHGSTKRNSLKLTLQLFNIHIYTRSILGIKKCIFGLIYAREHK